jgi:hypothetical protein
VRVSVGSRFEYCVLLLLFLCWNRLGWVLIIYVIVFLYYLKWRFDIMCFRWFKLISLCISVSSGSFQQNNLASRIIDVNLPIALQSICCVKLRIIRPIGNMSCRVFSQFINHLFKALLWQLKLSLSNCATVLVIIFVHSIIHFFYFVLLKDSNAWALTHKSASRHPVM